jgi:hypothetical protein
MPTDHSRSRSTAACNGAPMNKRPIPVKINLLNSIQPSLQVCGTLAFVF